MNNNKHIIQAARRRGLSVESYRYLVGVGDISPWHEEKQQRRKSKKRFSRNNPTPDAISSVAEVPNINGTWIDLDLHLIGACRTKLLETVLAHIKPFEKPDQSNRSDHRRNFELRVECILANAFRAHFYRSTDRVAYSRTQKANGNNERWTSPLSIRDTVDIMNAAGLLEKENGVWSGFGQAGHENGTQSTFWVAPALKEIKAACKANIYSIGKRPPAASHSIRMKAPKDEFGDKERIDFNETDETRGWASDIERYNRFITEFELWLDMSPREYKSAIAWRNKKQKEYSRQPGIKEIETFDVFLERVFNDATFDHGGRLYGPWYQSVPGWLRQRITINENPTVELDFAGMSVRMIYHQRGIDYKDDPYQLAELEDYAVKQGYVRDYYRDSVKKLVQAMLNNEDESISPEKTKVEQSFQPKFTRAEVRQMIEAKHGPIVDVFQTGEGKRNQRMDSDIAMEVIINLMNVEIPCLPIHDSFIVEEANQNILKAAMNAAYRRRLCFGPIIKTNLHPKAP